MGGGGIDNGLCMTLNIVTICIFKGGRGGLTILIMEGGLNKSTKSLWKNNKKNSCMFSYFFKK